PSATSTAARPSPNSPPPSISCPTPRPDPAVRPFPEETSNAPFDTAVRPGGHRCDGRGLPRLDVLHRGRPARAVDPPAGPRPGPPLHALRRPGALLGGHPARGRQPGA